MYEYQCEHCGHKQEETRKVSDRNNAPPCEECDKETHLIPSVGSFELKGKGWARDGYS